MVYLNYISGLNRFTDDILSVWWQVHAVLYVRKRGDPQVTPLTHTTSSIFLGRHPMATVLLSVDRAVIYLGTSAGIKTNEGRRR